MTCVPYHHPSYLRLELRALSVVRSLALSLSQTALLTMRTYHPTFTLSTQAGVLRANEMVRVLNTALNKTYIASHHRQAVTHVPTYLSPLFPDIPCFLLPVLPCFLLPVFRFVLFPVLHFLTFSIFLLSHFSLGLLKQVWT